MASHPTLSDLQIIRQVAVFRDLTPETFGKIIAPATAVELKAHDILFEQGDPATAFFVMIEGWTKHYRINYSGEETVTHVLTKGDSFAEAVALTGARFPATAEAVTDARIVRVPAGNIANWIMKDPDIALAMIASSSQRVRELTLHIEQLKAKSGVQRVAEFLMSLTNAESGPCLIALPYDKTLVAARLGLRPESLSRTFSKLRSIGVVVHSEHVSVSDIAKLHRLAADERSAIRGAFRRQ